MVTLERKIILDSTGLRVQLEMDFVRYYCELAHMACYNTKKYFIPKHGGHISIFTSNFPNQKEVLNKYYYELKEKYHGATASFSFEPQNIIQGGGNKGFTNFWIPVDLPVGKLVRDDLGLPADGKNFHGYHITLCSDKYFLKK